MPGIIDKLRDLWSDRSYRTTFLIILALLAVAVIQLMQA